jgi:hypothetical protein
VLLLLQLQQWRHWMQWQSMFDVTAHRLMVTVSCEPHTETKRLYTKHACTIAVTKAAAVGGSWFCGWQYQHSSAIYSYLFSCHSLLCMQLLQSPPLVVFWLYSSWSGLLIALDICSVLAVTVNRLYSVVVHQASMAFWCRTPCFTLSIPSTSESFSSGGSTTRDTRWNKKASIVFSSLEIFQT